MKSYYLFAVRHGETEWNSEFRIQGFKDSSLTKNGKKQAEILGKYIRDKYFIGSNILSKIIFEKFGLKKLNFLKNNIIDYFFIKNKMVLNYAYCSDLKRALDTAKILLKYLNFDIEKLTIKKELREKNFGIFEGLTLKEIKEKYPQYYDNFYENIHSYSWQIPEGESNEQFIKRISDFVFSLFSEIEDNSNVLFITHGGVCETLLKISSNMRDIKKRFYSLNNCSLNIFKVTEEEIKIVTWGELPYSFKYIVDLK